MKIGLFTDTFYPEINGVATSCLNLQRELTRRGHDVHVYAPKCKGWEENQHENVHYLASAPLLVLKDRNFAFPTPLTSWEAEKIDFDVVHTNSEFVMGMFGHHVAGSLGCAQVHTYHTVWEDYTYYITHGVADEAARRIARKYSQWWCNRFDRVITPTGKTLDLLRKYGVEAPIDIIPSGMDIARFDPARHDEAERLATRRECGLPERAPLLLNIGRIENDKNGYRYYWDGITPSVAVLIKAIDHERMAVAEAYGVEILSAEEWLRQSYDTYGDNLYELLQHNNAYADIKAPTTIEARYVTEDVPMSLVPISELARIAGVPTPNIDAVIQLTSSIYQRDFRAEGRCAKNLGIEGMSKAQVTHFFETGER